MQILNQTRGTILATAASRADTFYARGRGLMLTAALPEGSGLIIRPCNSIHMLFMRYPLDIVFADDQGKILFMYKGIKPWRVGRVVRGAKMAVELPEGTIARTGTTTGDRLAFG